MGTFHKKSKMFKKKSRPQTSKRKSLDSSDDESDRDASRPLGKGPVTALELKRRKKAGTSGAIQGSTGTPNEDTDMPKEDDRLHVTFAESGTAASLSADMATRRLDIDGILEDRPSMKKDEEILAGEDAERAAAGYQGLSGYKDYINSRSSGIRCD
jgi:hypothetical protein